MFIDEEGDRWTPVARVTYGVYWTSNLFDWSWCFDMSYDDSENGLLLALPQRHYSSRFGTQDSSIVMHICGGLVNTMNQNSKNRNMQMWYRFLKLKSFWLLEFWKNYADYQDNLLKSSLPNPNEKSGRNINLYLIDKVYSGKIVLWLNFPRNCETIKRSFGLLQHISIRNLIKLYYFDQNDIFFLINCAGSVHHMVKR